MNIALIGSGGREHALCQKISNSKLSKNIFCIPGNAGTSKIAKNIKEDILNFPKILKIIKSNKIDLVIVGPEEPLVRGIVDFLTRHKIKVFGPNKYAAKLEGSKAFMKSLCKKNNIPTAEFKICKNKKQVIKVSNEIFKGKFKSSQKLVLEEFLEGEEASYFLVVDKKGFRFFGSAQDHKRVGEKETGPNTGGMGAYSPAPIIDKNLEKKIINRIVEPTLKALKEKNKPYTGFLYVGLMIKNNDPYLIEYNVRMGDPECQVIIPRLKTDIVEIFRAGIKNNLKKLNIKWKKIKCMTIVLCSKGYPGKYKKNVKMKNFYKLNTNSSSFIFHAGTKLLNNEIFATGGRVLNVTVVGKNFIKIRKKIFKIIKKINWTNGFFRKDIGWRIIRN